MLDSLRRAKEIADRGGLSLLAERGYRFLTANRRVLPDFLVIGAKKAGTTSLYMYLNQHPQIVWAERKEIRFFNCNYGEGETWYRMQFPLHSEIQEQEDAVDARVHVGEASPNYLYHPLVAQRISELLPDVRLIALLRDPIERAWSDYHHSVKWDEEPVSFENALQRECERTPEIAEAVEKHGGCPDYFHWQSYLYKGHYATHLQRFSEVFDEEQMLLLKSEDLFEETQRVFDRICSFLSIPSRELEDADAYNAGSRSHMDEEVRQMLRDYYEQPNRDLAARYGIDFE